MGSKLTAFLCELLTNIFLLKETLWSVKAIHPTLQIQRHPVSFWLKRDLSSSLCRAGPVTGMTRSFPFGDQAVARVPEAPLRIHRRERATIEKAFDNEATVTLQSSCSYSTASLSGGADIGSAADKIRDSRLLR